MGQSCDSKSRGLYFSLWKRKRNHHLGTAFFLHHRIVSAIKRAGFVSNRVSYIVLGGRWCNIVLNVHAPSEEENYDTKVIFMRN